MTQAPKIEIDLGDAAKATFSFDFNPTHLTEKSARALLKLVTAMLLFGEEAVENGDKFQEQLRPKKDPS
jgi:hypothetical protein